MYTRELTLAMRIARSAGDILLPFFRSAAEVSLKAGQEPVTEADRSANAYLVGELQLAFPLDGILAEESRDDMTRLDKRRVWLVDPLDGTSDFIASSEEFCVMIGLVADGRPVLGVIFQPVSGLCYAAVDGSGAFLEAAGGQRRDLHVSKAVDIAALRPIVSRTHRSPLVDTIVSALGVQKERAIGSLGLKSAALARSEADFYLHPSLGPKEWDTCAPEVLLREAGGVMTDCWNQPLRYNQRDVSRPFGVLGSNGACHAGLVQALGHVLDGLGIDRNTGFRRTGQE